MGHGHAEGKCSLGYCCCAWPRRAGKGKPRVTIAEDAFAWADSGRANCILNASSTRATSTSRRTR